MARVREYCQFLGRMLEPIGESLGLIVSLHHFGYVRLHRKLVVSGSDESLLKGPTSEMITAHTLMDFSHCLFRLQIVQVP